MFVLFFCVETYVLFLCRTCKPPGAMESNVDVILTTKTDKYSLYGYATLKTVLTIHNGKTDYMASMPPFVKKSLALQLQSATL